MEKQKNVWVDLHPGFEMGFIDTDGTIKFVEHVGGELFLVYPIDGSEEDDIKQKFIIKSN